MGGGNTCLYILTISLITYIGGIVIEKYKAKWSYILFFVLTIIPLLIFKYSLFTVSNINRVLNVMGANALPVDTLTGIVIPAGMSFYTFQALTYLSDVYRRGCIAERNFLTYSSFVSFFPTLMSGPIQKSRELLPQIKNSHSFDYKKSIYGYCLFIWGIFEKIVVANSLIKVSNSIYSSLENYTGVYYLIAAVSFSFYIYADFSAYSDMARGIAAILGFDIKKNFQNPYLSTSLSDFWNRWHMTLNEWFIENVYIPLGGNRKGSTRKYINIFIVFLISGLWHGASWNFIIWGVLNGILVIIGQILRPCKKRIYQLLHIDERLATVKVFKCIIVFIIITITWVFFGNNIGDSLTIIKGAFSFPLVEVFDLKLYLICGTVTKTLLTLIAVIFFCTVQFQRRKGSMLWQTFRKQPSLCQIFLLAILVCISIYVASAATSQVSTNFIYFDF